jgi:(R,R)-butanediol dehydrogenase/meso-butanediol dehydrogenase/diacetyl reductase
MASRSSECIIWKKLIPPKLIVMENLVGDSGPHSLGHEFSAVVAEIHPSVVGFQLGDQVVVNPLWRCGSCHMCTTERPNSCLKQKYYGYNLDGGLSRSLVMDATRCYQVPRSVGLDIAALVEPLAVAWHAIQSSGLQQSQSAMVIGTGPVGVATILCLQALGIDEIMVVGRSLLRNNLVKSLGIKDIYRSSDGDLLGAARSLFDGYVVALIMGNQHLKRLVLVRTWFSMLLLLKLL